MRGYRNFCQGGGGGGGVQARLSENSSEVFSSFFLILNFNILQFYRGYPMVISKKTILFQGFRGSPTFSREVGGANAYFYRNPYNLSFSRGESRPLSPLLTRSCSLSPSGSAHELPRENAHLMKDLGNTV